MPTKYRFEMPKTIINSDINRLTNQLWKLIPMKENEENWFDQLETVIAEISGLHIILNPQLDFLVLLSKLEGLRDDQLDFRIYRKTVFETISLLRGLLV